MSTATDDDDPFEEQREEVDNAMVQLFEEYGRDHDFEAVVAILASVFARVLDLAPPVLLGLAIDSVIQQNKPFLPWLPRAWVPPDDDGKLILMGGLIAGSFLLGAAFHWVRNWGWNSFSQHIQHEVRTDTYDKMQRLNMDFFATKQTGEMMSILSNDVNRLERFLNDGLNSAFRLSVMVVAIGVYLFFVNWQLAVLTMLPVPIIAVFTYRFVKAIQPKYADVRSSVGHLNSRLENNLGGIQVIKTSNTESYESERVDDVSQGYFDANWGAITIRIKFLVVLQSGLDFAAGTLN